jgi:hypothetical protein
LPTKIQFHSQSSESVQLNRTEEEEQPEIRRADSEVQVKLGEGTESKAQWLECGKVAIECCGLLLGTVILILLFQGKEECQREAVEEIQEVPRSEWRTETQERTQSLNQTESIRNDQRQKNQIPLCLRGSVKFDKNAEIPEQVLFNPETGEHTDSGTDGEGRYPKHM